MTRKARSARGDLVDFDLLKIKQQLATSPAPVAVDQRRKFIDEKDGIKSTVRQISAAIPSALSIAVESAKTSELANKEESKSVVKSKSKE